MAHLKHYEHTGTARFITLSCYHNYNLFKTDQTKEIFITNLKQLKSKYQFKLFGFVIMPNHVHLVLLPESDQQLSKIIGVLKSLTAREIFALWHKMGLEIFNKLKIVRNGKTQNIFWQRRYYDHNCRTKETTIEKTEYCHNNPVVSGIVKNQSEWRWSSYNWYNGNKDVILEMDKLE